MNAFKLIDWRLQNNSLINIGEDCIIFLAGIQVNFNILKPQPNIPIIIQSM
jgi:hypothetical protein